MPTSWMIKVGAVAATKRNLAQNIESGFSILVTKCPGVQARNVEEKSGKEALYLLFKGKSDADAASRLLLAEPATDSARAELATALAKAEGPESGPHTIRHFQQISAEWRALCEPEEEQQEQPPDEPDPMLGKVLKLTLPITDQMGTVIGLHDGDVEVVDNGSDGNYTVSFMHEGVRTQVSVMGSVLQRALAK